MMIKGAFMIYEEIKIHELLEEKIKEDFTIEPVTVMKTNDREWNGLRLTVEGSNTSPTIYIDEAYEAYTRGADPDDIAVKLSREFSEAERSTPPAVDISEDCSVFADKPFTMRVLDAASNREYLSGIPHMSVGNGLVLICDIRIAENEKGCYAAVVNNDILTYLGKSKSEVFREALGNAWETDRPHLFRMTEMLFKGGKTNLFDDPLAAPEIKEPEMFILSNASGIHGAAALFYPDVQEKISELFGSSYYALPSSTEEFIIMPEHTAGPGPEVLTDMVRSANRSVVEPEQILCDRVFKFDRELGKLQDVTYGREISDRVSEAR